MHLYNQLIPIPIPPKIGLNLFKEPCRTSPLCVNRRRYTFTLDSQKSWWGATGIGGYTAKCAVIEDET